VGIGDIEKFEGAPLEMDPRYVFPGAKVIIGLGFRIARGYIRGIEEGTQFFQYPSMGYGGINEVYAPIVIYEIGKFLEDNGYEAVAFRNTGGRGSISDMTGKKGDLEFSPELHHKRVVSYTHSLREEFPAPDVFMHFRIAAYICGLGEIGYSKVFLTPQFGPLQRFAFLLTDAPLKPDPIYSGPSLCLKCMACAKACPGGCISTTEKVSITIAGHKVEWGKLDEWSCFAYYMGANISTNPFLPENAFKDVPEGDKIIKGKSPVRPQQYSKVADIINRYYPPPPNGYNPPKCGGCLRACINVLEKRGILKGKFKTEFRKMT